jgi:hypothetical protein
MKLTVILVVALIGLNFFLYAAPRDDTDSATERSGVVLVNDALTGCQYLRTLWPSSITPRMGADGKQICASAK